MGAPQVLWSESAAFDALRAFLVAALPEVPERDIYRARPSAAPGKFGGPSVQIAPLTAAPEVLSPLGAVTNNPQRQRWRVTVTTAAAGAWSVRVLGEDAPFTAGVGDDAMAIAAGLRAAVDGLSVAVTTEAVAPPPPGAFGILGDVAGQSLGVSVTAPAGGAYSLAVVDDNIRRAVYNWGLWRVRLIFRAVMPAQAGAASVVSPGDLLERVRLWLISQSMPVTSGSAYPFYADNLQAAPARLSFHGTSPPVVYDEVEGAAWVRVAVMDVEFQVPVCLAHDVPSLDAIGLSAAPTITTT